MSWIETWLDAATAPSLATCIAAARQAGAQGFNIYLGGRYAYQGGGGWPTSTLPADLVAAGYGVFGTWVSLAPGQGGYATGYQDGKDACAAAAAHPTIALVFYDVEPSTWYVDPAGVAQAMAGFRDAVHAAGRPAGIYGLQATLRAAPGYDRYWGTFDLGSPDPALSFGPSGSRAIQYAQTTIAGVDWDISHSEFSLLAGRGGDPKEEPMARLVQGDQHPGIAFLALDPVYGPKRGVPDPTWLASYQGALAQAGLDSTTLTIPQQVLDAMESEPGYETFDPDAVTASLQAIQASLANISGAGTGTLTAGQQAELDAINQATAALSKHLGVGTA